LGLLLINSNEIAWSDHGSQAAKIGANGVLLLNTGNKSGDMVGFYSGGVFYAEASQTKTATGRAIFVIQE
jgi:hypothetical protein